MSHREKLEQILDLLINEEADRASEMLHQVVVEKAREIYEELVEDEETDEGADSEEEVDESFGGDVQDRFSQKITKDNNDIDSDELYDDAEEVGDDQGEEGDDVDMGFQPGEEGQGEQPVEDRVCDLEAALADLRSEFDRLMADEIGEPGHEDLAAEYSGEDETDFPSDEEGEYGQGEEEDDVEESMFEATKFYAEVGDLGMGSEGKYSGTGSKSAGAGSVNKTTPLSKGTGKMEYGQGPTEFAKSAGEGKQADKTARKETAPTNVNVKQGSVNADLSGEGKFSGTGAHSKKGAVNTKSPLSKKPN
jgi:hypothetical protein